MNVLAYFNHNRWVVDCPKCGKNGSTLAEPMPEVSPYSAENGKFICPNCFPGMIAIEGHNKDGSIKFNQASQATARQLAGKRGEIYDVVFPDKKSEIVKVVSVRPVTNRNWMPGETIAFLRKENKGVA